MVHIVDDDELVRKGLERLMRASGLTSRSYDCPERFLEAVGTDAHGCVLLDITMPGMNGLQVQAALKARGNAIPVIAVSARDDDETRQRARELDAKCFFRKPVDDQALLDAITWLARVPTGTPDSPQDP